MAETSTPFDGVPMYDTEWSDLFSMVLNNGVWDPYTGPKTNLQVHTDLDGRQVKVRPGKAVIRGHVYTNTTTKVIPIPPNTTGSTRNDYVVLRLDPVNKRITAVHKSGSTGGAAPPLTQTTTGIFEIPLAGVSIPNNFNRIETAAITDLRDWIGPAAMGYSWRSYTPTYTNLTGSSAVFSPSGQTGIYKVMGNFCVVHWRADGSITSGSGEGFAVSLPMTPSEEAYGAGRLGNGNAVVSAVQGQKWAAIRVSGTAMQRVDQGVSITANAQGVGIANSSRSYSQYIGYNVVAGDPAVAGFPAYPQVQAREISTGTQFVITAGQPGVVYGIRLSFLVPSTLSAGNLNGSGFTLVYPIEWGA